MCEGVDDAFFEVFVGLQLRGAFDCLLLSGLVTNRGRRIAVGRLAVADFQGGVGGRRGGHKQAAGTSQPTRSSPAL